MRSPLPTLHPTTVPVTLSGHSEATAKGSGSSAYIQLLLLKKNLLSRARRHASNTKDKIPRNELVRTGKTDRKQKNTLKNRKVRLNK